ncbi:MAG: acetate--CoA ligase family protein [Ignavibacteria bacterium]|nr:acetate--CoA ligase family protein [Ignavibacteria bacterium]
MIVKELVFPKSIVVVGGSNDVRKPGGKVLQNLIEWKFEGDLFVINPKEKEVQGVKSFSTIEALPPVDLAFFAIPANLVPQMMENLARRGTRAFIVLSAGFSEMGEEGKRLEKKLVDIVSSVNGSLIGPNCIGVITEKYKGVFAGPIPEYSPEGCDFVSASGATAVFILEEAITRGIKFSQIFSVGNSAQIGIEEVLEYWDLTFDSKSSKVKLIYAEQISNPNKFLKHSSSLIEKGCRIAGIKSGRTKAGARAVTSHTGSLAGEDEMVDALFRKAGIIRCEGRMELVYVAGVLSNKKILGDRFAIVTHAGGPGVMLADTLESEGIKIPPIEGTYADELLKHLHFGSSVANPIDFLATGTAEQLDLILDYVENKFEQIDASVVIFGTPGLFDVSDAYRVIVRRMMDSCKPIFPVLPSILQAKGEIELFKSLGGIYFNDEVALGKSIAKVVRNKRVGKTSPKKQIEKKEELRNLFKDFSNNFVSTEIARKALVIAGIPYVDSKIVENKAELQKSLDEFRFPLAMKVLGLLHKSESGGVRLNIRSQEEAEQTFEELMQIEGAQAVEIQQMLDGIELFFGVKYEHGYGHLIVFGLGGIFVEILRDVASMLAPLSLEEARQLVSSIKGYPILKGARRTQPVDEEKVVEILLRLSELIEIVPEIQELDLNPAIAFGDKIFVVDARIKVGKLK